MSINPGPTKQAKEVIFSSKRTKDHNPLLRLNDFEINVDKSHKHLGVIVDEKIMFSKQDREAKRGVGISSKYTPGDILDQI